MAVCAAEILLVLYSQQFFSLTVECFILCIPSFLWNRDTGYVHVFRYISYSFKIF